MVCLSKVKQKETFARNLFLTANSKLLTVKTESDELVTPNHAR